jgi:integrase/recombinase XerD
MSGLAPSGTVERESMAAPEKLVAALQQWHRVQGLTEASVQADQRRLPPFWRFLKKRGVLREGGVELAAVTPALLADYQAYLFDYVSARSGRKITAYSQTNYLVGVQVLFRFLCQTGRMAHDPSAVIRLPRAAVTIPAAILTPSEVQRLLLMPNTRTVLGFRDRCILEVLWSTGIRMKELLTLDVEDVRFDQKLLFIREGKGNKQRFIPIGASALRWLREYLAAVRPVLTRESWQSRGWRPAALSSRLFLSNHGQPLHGTSVGNMLRTYQRQARLKKRLTGHVFRHTLATEMLKAGADLRHIQEMLGHADLTTTQRYLHVVKEELKRVHQASHPREQMPTAPIRYRGLTTDL